MAIVISQLPQSNAIPTYSDLCTKVADDGTDQFTHNYNFGFANKPVTPTPFEELTEAKVIEWIKRDSKGMFEEQADAELEAYKLRKAAPVMTSGTPW